MAYIIPLKTIDLSIILALASAVILYFGKIITNVSAQKYDYVDCYIRGVFFSIGYILLPFGIAFYSIPYVSGIETLIFLATQVITLVLVSRSVEQKRSRMIGLYEKNKKENSVLAKISNRIKERVYGVFGKEYSAFILAYITILANLRAYNSGDWNIFALSSTFTFFILTFCALIFGLENERYLVKTVYMREDESKKGKILRYDDFFIVLQNEGKITLVNKDEIRYIE